MPWWLEAESEPRRHSRFRPEALNVPNALIFWSEEESSCGEAFMAVFAAASSPADVAYGPLHRSGRAGDHEWRSKADRGIAAHESSGNVVGMGHLAPRPW